MLCGLDEQKLACPRRTDFLQRKRELFAHQSVGQNGSTSDDTVGTQGKSIRQLVHAIAKAKRPLITGYFGDVQTSRQVIRLGELIGATVDHWGSEPAFDQIAATQNVGHVSTTLAEMRFRANGILLVGDDRVLHNYPQLTWWMRTPSGFQEDRRVVLLGDFSKTAVQSVAEHLHVTHFACDLKGLPSSLYQYERDLQKKGVDSEGSLFRDSDYNVVVWSPALLTVPIRDVWLSMLSRWMLLANERRRVAGIALSDPSQLTFQQVALWRTGFPGRLQYQNKSWTSDIHQCRAENAQRECDLIIWVDTRDEAHSFPEALPTPGIVLTVNREYEEPDLHTTLKLRTESRQMFRCDGVSPFPVEDAEGLPMHDGAAAKDGKPREPQTGLRLSDLVDAVEQSQQGAAT